MKITQTPNSPLLDKTGQANKAVPAKNDRQGAISESRATKGSASIEISDNAKLMKRAAEVAGAAADVRAEKVAALKKAVREGTYKVDNEGVADRLVEDHLNNHLGKNSL